MFSRLIACILSAYLATMAQAICSQGSNLLYGDEICYTSKHIRKRSSMKDTFKYLDIPPVEAITVHDDFDCHSKCLENSKCHSINVAASKAADGKLWCELLSSDKYKNFTMYHVNQTSNHYFRKSPCSSFPCKNGATCVPNYDDDTFHCICKKGFSSKLCRTAVASSCKEAYDLHNFTQDVVARIKLPAANFMVQCHKELSGCGGGGWTPVMKIDGSKTTFHYDSKYWKNKIDYNRHAGKTGFDDQETKLPTYWNSSFDKICLGMKIGEQRRFILINKQAESLYSLIADGEYRATSLGRDTWKSLVGPEASLQNLCNKEGFNAAEYSGTSIYAHVRIGVISNELNNCAGCDSRLGFGGGGQHDDSNTCGNEAYYLADNGNKKIKAMGYIFVQ